MGNSLKKGQKEKDKQDKEKQDAPQQRKVPPVKASGAVNSSNPSGSNAPQFKPPQAVPTSSVLPAGDNSHFNNKLTIEDFELLKVLGKGSFGKVMLVKKNGDESGTLYAMKTLRKAALTPDKLYMVIDYMVGGELFNWLKKDKKFSETRCRLYAAEISLALEALHSANIIYRDLKPENILLDAAGHLRLTDFGLAKSGIMGPGAEGGTKTFCGTPEYLAPEILENKGHGKAVDWWALGTLLYEMITGLPPFYDTNVQRMYHKILHDPLKFPRSEKFQLSEPAKDVLRRLLERKLSDRLGSGSGSGSTATSGGANELKLTPFFSVLDFERVATKQYRPEFIPPASRSEGDVRNFDSEFTSEQAADSLVVSQMSETMQEKSNFVDFSFMGNIDANANNKLGNKTRL